MEGLTIQTTYNFFFFFLKRKQHITSEIKIQILKQEEVRNGIIVWSKNN